MTTAPERLYDLLPPLYRLRDSERGQPLRALLAIIASEFSAVEAHITGLYDNWFIETCDEWMVPYIGDLLGVRGLNTIQATAFSQRAYVANTLFYRRRKGTAHLLEKLAADITGWPAHAVEFFELLHTTQYMNHCRPFNTTPDLRDTNRLNLLDHPFDTLPHTADVRHINKRRGRYNIPNIGIFLWRLQNYPLLEVTPRQAVAPNNHGYHMSPVGHPAPLFNAPAGDGAPDEQRVPAPIRPLDIYRDLTAYEASFGGAQDPPENSRYYGPERSLQIIKDGDQVRPGDILCRNLSNWARPPAGKVAVDVIRGRITFAAGEEPARSLAVSYNYGFSADLGGGPYDRRGRLAEITSTIQEFKVGHDKTGDDKIYATLSDAVNAWSKTSNPPAVIRIYDSATYDAGLTLSLPPGGSLVIDCESGERPTLVNASPLTVTSAATSAEDTAAFSLSGLLIEGSLMVSGKLHLSIADCTLVPGIALDEEGFPRYPDSASITVSGTDVADLDILISRSITGALELPEDCRGVIIRDSIVAAPLPKDADEPSRAAIGASGAGPVTTVERTTVFGKVFVRELSLASDSIFVHPVTAERRQEGCVRFSYVPAGSQTPRRYRCQPGLAIADREKALDPAKLSATERDAIVMRVRPQFTSMRYGEAAFAQLSTPCAGEIKSGAEDGSEMGAFCMLQQPQRMANLQIALDEYLRFGLEAGIFQVT